MEECEIKIPKENVLKSLSISDVIRHFGLKHIINEMDSSEVIEIIGYMNCQEIIDIDYAIEFVEKNGFIVNEKK